MLRRLAVIASLFAATACEFSETKTLHAFGDLCQRYAVGASVPFSVRGIGGDKSCGFSGKIPVPSCGDEFTPTGSAATSSAPTVVSVDKGATEGEFVLNALAAGKATISITSADGLEEPLTFDVETFAATGLAKWTTGSVETRKPLPETLLFAIGTTTTETIDVTFATADGQELCTQGASVTVAGEGVDAAFAALGDVVDGKLAGSVTSVVLSNQKEGEGKVTFTVGGGASTTATKGVRGTAFSHLTAAFDTDSSYLQASAWSGEARVAGAHLIANILEPELGRWIDDSSQADVTQGGIALYAVQKDGEFQKGTVHVVVSAPGSPAEAVTLTYELK